MLGIIYQKLINKINNYSILIISRVLSFTGEILSKIRQDVLEKSRILWEESILPHSNGIY